MLTMDLIPTLITILNAITIPTPIIHVVSSYLLKALVAQALLFKTLPHFLFLQPSHLRLVIVSF
jgi:hypothetical protein